MSDIYSYNTDMAQRFRGYLPVVIDVETAGFNANTDALLEIAAVTLAIDNDGNLTLAERFAFHVEPFEGANIEDEAIAFNGIDPFNPLRGALPENEALTQLLSPIRSAVKASGCKRAILVGHNATFDLNFLNAAVARCSYKRNPFHPFSTLDTVTLSALAYGQTVLAKTAMAAGMEWDNHSAHSALYDTEKTAELFCLIMNRWNQLTDDKPWLLNREN